MFLATLATGYWQANCYLVAAPGLSQCVIIDPGQGSADGVRTILTDNQLTPRAILLTHGHFDHVADAATLADEFNVAVYVHAADQHLLTDPAAGLSAEGAAMVRKLVGASLPAPARVETYEPGRDLHLAQLTFTITEAPGHTAGSVLIGTDYHGHPAIRRLVFSGDVVFAGSVGRTDLPGGNSAVMMRTLSQVVLGLGDEVALLPGHGEQTTMVAERATNPYLQPNFLRN
ncbi:MAG: MBL fold metallo-hydrolase [Propionibacteriales bacterium]|nr:MBL fold metallo-hydrolase [Propionibacteriales bacterium]